VRRQNATKTRGGATIAAYSSRAKDKISKRGKQSLAVEALKNRANTGKNVEQTSSQKTPSKPHTNQQNRTRKALRKSPKTEQQ
jgi:hypothetical protein